MIEKDRQLSLCGKWSCLALKSPKMGNDSHNVATSIIKHCSIFQFSTALKTTAFSTHYPCQKTKKNS